MTEEQERVVIRDNRKIDRERAADAAAADRPSDPATAAGAAGVGQEDSLEGTEPSADAVLLEERTRDLQRLQAEYANYRKRTDRDRLAAGDVAVGRTLAELLPIVDDLDRAKTHGHLTGPLKAVADKLDGVFAKLGLEAFGEVGDPFDPALHEAVLHDESDAVTVPTCTTIMRRGYRHKDRLLRAAMVGVSDPIPGADAATIEATLDATAGAHRTESEAPAEGEAAGQADPSPSQHSAPEDRTTPENPTPGE